MFNNQGTEDAMKISKVVLSAMFVALFAINQTLGQGSSQPRFTQQKMERIEENLAICLESTIPGVQATAASTVRQLIALVPEYSFSHRITIALMRIVKDEGATSGSRILAALALHDLDSEMGNFAIKMQARFGDCEKFKHFCALLAYTRNVENQEALADRSSRNDFVQAK
jgi:hypothetical protein